MGTAVNTWTEKPATVSAANQGMPNVDRFAGWIERYYLIGNTIIDILEGQ
jgi:hypothetical protein